MVQTAHFGAQTNLLVPRCFNLMHCNSIKIGRIDGSRVPGCVLPGFAVRPVEKPVRTYRLGHVNRNAKGRKRDIFADLAPALRVKTERRFGLCTRILCALISPVPTPYGISCPDRNCPVLGGASPCHYGLGGGTPLRAKISFTSTDPSTDLTHLRAGKANFGP